MIEFEKIKDLLVCMFMIEEPLFFIDSSSIPDEFSRFSYYSMTWDDYHNRIVMICSSYRSDSLWIAYHGSFFEVIPRFSVWDFFECFPCASLKLGSTRC